MISTIDVKESVKSISGLLKEINFSAQHIATKALFSEAICKHKENYCLFSRYLYWFLLCSAIY